MLRGLRVVFAQLPVALLTYPLPLLVGAAGEDAPLLLTHPPARLGLDLGDNLFHRLLTQDLANSREPSPCVRLHPDLPAARRGVEEPHQRDVQVDFGPVPGEEQELLPRQGIV